LDLKVLAIRWQASEDLHKPAKAGWNTTSAIARIPPAKAGGKRERNLAAELPLR
jgi:hypothetical protein